MNIELPVGMATPYFVTQADRSIATVEDPAVLVLHNEPLTLDTLGRFLAFLNEDPPPRKPGFRLFGKPEKMPPPPPALDRARAMLKVITVDNTWPDASQLVYTSHPVVILAKTIEVNALQALTVIKLRGYFQTLALDISGCLDIVPALLASLGREKSAGIPLFAGIGRTVAGYGSFQGLTVVSGLRATVVATGLTADQVLAQHPDLATAPR